MTVVLHVCDWDILSFTHSCCSFSGWDAVLRFMWSRLSHGMLRSAAFKNAKRWGVYTVCLLCFFPSAVNSKPSLHRRPFGAVTQHTEKHQWLIWGFACISNYFSIPREIFFISALHYWPYSKACNDGAGTVMEYLAGSSYKSHSLGQQVDMKSILVVRELTLCFSYGFSLCAD